MSIARLLLGALLLVGATAGVASTVESDVINDAAVLNRQILVMLRTPPPHFRPDQSYTGAYDARGGREARRRIAERIANRYGLNVVTNWPMPSLGVDCFVMTASADDAVPAIVDELARDPSVESVQAMNRFHLLAHNDPLYPLQPTAKTWHLADVHKVATGKRVSVATIDTGVESDHPDLVGRIAVTRDFVDVRNDNVAELHGTAIAAIIAARADDGVGIAGVAPDATLLALRACWQSGRAGAVCSTFTLAKALQFALDQKAEIINLSLTGPRDRLLERLIDVGIARGVVVTAAVDATARDGGFPAAHVGVLAVSGDDVHDTAENALVAPSREIPTAITGRKWGFVSGSSFAAAQISGLVALLREVAPSASPREIRAALVESATPGPVAAPRRATVDACAAVARIGGVCACACTVAAQIAPSPQL